MHRGPPTAASRSKTASVKGAGNGVARCNAAVLNFLYDRCHVLCEAIRVCFRARYRGGLNDLRCWALVERLCVGQVGLGSLDEAALLLSNYLRTHGKI